MNNYLQVIPATTPRDSYRSSVKNYLSIHIGGKDTYSHSWLFYYTITDEILSRATSNQRRPAGGDNSQTSIAMISGCFTPPMCFINEYNNNKIFAPELLCQMDTFKIL